MIKINNKSRFIRLTIVATLVLLIQPIQALLDNRVIPLHLKYHPQSDFNIQNLDEYYFCWRYIKGEKGTHKVLTVEEGNTDLEEQLSQLLQPETFRQLKPVFFIREADFDNKNHLINSARFNLRQFTRRGTQFWVVTIEQFGDLEKRSSSMQVCPFDLVGTNEFRSKINVVTEFKWKDVRMNDGKIYRAVTLEN